MHYNRIIRYSERSRRRERTPPIDEIRLFGGCPVVEDFTRTQLTKSNDESPYSRYTIMSTPLGRPAKQAASIPPRAACDTPLTRRAVISSGSSTNRLRAGVRNSGRNTVLPSPSRRSVHRSGSIRTHRIFASVKSTATPPH